MGERSRILGLRGQPLDLNDPRIPTPGAPGVPTGWSLTVPMVCNCDNPQCLTLTRCQTMAVHAKDPEHSQQAPVVTCPSCGRQWKIGDRTAIGIDLAIVVTEVGGGVKN